MVTSPSIIGSIASPSNGCHGVTADIRRHEERRERARDHETGGRVGVLRETDDTGSRVVQCCHAYAWLAGKDVFRATLPATR